VTLADAILADNSRIEVLHGKRKLVGEKDFNNERFFVVYQGKRKLVETENEDEACRFLTGEK